ncbi:MAG: prepilin-type N-terminal cleavage/methylation domain-containing protein [Planctomycetota bacterium]
MTAAKPRPSVARAAQRFSAARRRQQRPGLTLLELLIALTIVLSITLVVTPPVLRRLDERAFTSACDLLSQQMLLARAHAQSIGGGVEVVHDGASQITQARVFLAAPVDPAARGSAPALIDDGEQRAITEPWAMRRLHDGLRLSDVDPRDDATVTGLPSDAFGGEDFVGDDADPLDELLRLAVFLPDGSSLLGSVIWVTDDDGRIGRLTTNAFTGLVDVERLDGTIRAIEDDEDDAEVEDESARDEPAPRENRSGPRNDTGGGDEVRESSASDEADSGIDDGPQEEDA